jgi:hypothetical protein
VVPNPSPYIYPRVYFASRVQSVDSAEAMSRVNAALSVCAQCVDVLTERLGVDYVEGPATPQLDDSGSIEWTGSSDRIVLTFPVSSKPRFLILNEGYSTRWAAEAQGRALPVYSTNVVMRGVAVPPGVGEVVLTYHSFLNDAWLYTIGVFGACALAWWFLRHYVHTHSPLSQAPRR